MGSLKRFDLNKIIKEFNTVNMFETGTLLGDGVAYALESLFTRIVSVEIVPQLAAQASARFTGPRVEIIEADSVSALEKVLPTMEGNCLFWLDAHFPGADARLTTYSTGDDNLFRLPLIKELAVINTLRKKFNDVFIVDDLRIYEDGPYENGPVPQDARPQKEISIDFVYRFFADTHYIFKSYLDEGYLILFPKRVYNQYHTMQTAFGRAADIAEDCYYLE